MKLLKSLILFVLFLTKINSYLTASTMPEEQEDISYLSNPITMMRLEPKVEQSSELTNSVFSGNPFFNIARYLGRYEVGSIQSASKRFHEFFKSNKEIWNEYFCVLLLDKLNFSNREDSVEYYEKSVRNYFKPSLLIIDEEQFSLTGSSYKGFIGENTNDDKSVIVGSVKDYNNQNVQTAFRHVKGGELELLGLLNQGRWSRALNTNLDGTVIVGVAADRNNENKSTAFRYLKGKNLEPLGLLNGGNSSRALHTDSHGKEIIGIANDGNNNNYPTVVKWTKDGIECLQQIKESGSFHVLNINNNGSIAVGYESKSTAHNTRRPFIFKDDTIDWLQAFVAGKPACATSTNFDGSIIGGWANAQKKKQQIAVLWIGGQILDISSFFKSLGVLKDSESLQSINGISYDGSDFIGSTLNGKIYIAHKPRLNLLTMNFKKILSRSKKLSGERLS